MKKSLNEKQIKMMLDIVQEYRNKHKPLTSAFEEVAKKTNRKANSIRNFYYSFIANAKNSIEGVKVDLTKHKVEKINKFTKEDEVRLKRNIEEKLKQGFSVRKACLMLAGNNPDLMIRYQNKYRNMVAEKDCKGLVNERITNCTNIKDINSEQLIETDKNKDNIIQFPQRKKSKEDLTDEEIKSLFLGIVKMIKKNAIKQADNFSNAKLEVVNNQLRKSIIKTNQKEEEVENLNNQNAELKEQIKLLQNKIQKLRSAVVKNSKAEDNVKI